MSMKNKQKQNKKGPKTNKQKNKIENDQITQNNPMLQGEQLSMFTTQCCCDLESGSQSVDKQMQNAGYHHTQSERFHLLSI